LIKVPLTDWSIIWKGTVWDRLENGALLTAAEEAEFEVFLTADKNLRYQQNLATRKIAVGSPWKLAMAACAIAYPRNRRRSECGALPGSYIEVDIPLPPKKPLSPF
jgi:hypothetical protein